MIGIRSTIEPLEASGEKIAHPSVRSARSIAKVERIFVTTCDSITGSSKRASGVLRERRVSRSLQSRGMHGDESKSRKPRSFNSPSIDGYTAYYSTYSSPHPHRHQSLHFTEIHAEKEKERERERGRTDL